MARAKQISQWPLAKLKPYERNPKAHTSAQISRLAASIQRFGWTVPILENPDGVILAGHARYYAAQELALKQAPVLVVDSLTSDEERAYRIADNKLAELAAWDVPLLEEELKAFNAEELLAGLGVSMGFDTDYLAALGRDFDNVSPEMGKPHVGGTLLGTFDSEGDTQQGTALEEVGYDLNSVWGRTGQADAPFAKYALSLPRPKESAERYSRSPLQEMWKICRTYMREGDYFLEACAGWWTFSCTAALEGFPGEGIDLWDVSMDFGRRQIAHLPAEAQGLITMHQGDALAMPFPDGHFSFAYCNPPFHDTERYTDNENDLSAIKGYDAWLAKSGELFTEIRRVLKPDSLLVTAISDHREEGVLIPVHTDWIKCIGACGFDLHDLVIQHTLSAQGRIWRQAYNRRRTAKTHEYVITFRRP